MFLYKDSPRDEISPRSSYLGSPRDDRFSTPRGAANSSGNSSEDQWATPR